MFQTWNNKPWLKRQTVPLPKELSSGNLQAIILTYIQAGSGVKVTAEYEKENSNELTTEKWDLRTDSLGATCTTLNLCALSHYTFFTNVFESSLCFGTHPKPRLVPGIEIKYNK